MNLSRTFFFHAGQKGSGEGRITEQEWETAAVQVCKALGGTYEDTGGRKRSVAGDMTKVRYVPTLSSAAKKLLQHIEHTTKKIPGAQETRRQMRFDTNALRVKYGVPIFVTFSPDEKHNLLMFAFELVM